MSVDIKSVSAGATHLVSKLGPRFPPGLAATKKGYSVGYRAGSAAGYKRGKKMLMRGRRCIYDSTGGYKRYLSGYPKSLGKRRYR